MAEISVTELQDKLVVAWCAIFDLPANMFSWQEDARWALESRMTPEARARCRKWYRSHREVG